MTQEYLRGHAALAPAGSACCPCGALWTTALAALVEPLLCLSDSTEGEDADCAALPKSKGAPGVLGVLAAEPKEAKAPEPRPKAEEAPGEATPLVFNGAAPFGRVTRFVVEGSRLREGKLRLWFSELCEERAGFAEVLKT